MPFVPDTVKKAKDGIIRLFSGRSGVSGAAAIRRLIRRALEPVRGGGRKLWALFPAGVRGALPWLEEKLGFMLAGLGLALLILLPVMIAAGRPAPAKEPGAGTFKAVPVPPEDLFLPEEPDFLPPVILERERRDAWTADDAEPYWYNPLEEGEEGWREQVEKVIDELLERVP
ncbi:MAG: hypothetical protein LBI94_06480 [Treponema sp.]|jgi:hypothetical protein|nr:hypothetical protein [Treponema sp.]